MYWEQQIVVIDILGNLFTKRRFRKSWLVVLQKNGSLVVWIFCVTLFEDCATMILFKITRKITFIQKCVHKKAEDSANILKEPFRAQVE